MNDDQTPIAIPYPELKSLAGAVAGEMKSAGETLAPLLRSRFILVRAALFQRGVYDPVLVRFDTATVPKAGIAEVADQLARIAESM